MQDGVPARNILIAFGKVQIAWRSWELACSCTPHNCPVEGAGLLGSAHLRMQSELLPSAWPVEDPSKDQSGNSLGSMLVIGF